ncbi:MAG: Stk1 family PASTA domain-containing Ser/Thr kinase [Actinomycetota bacterium]
MADGDGDLTERAMLAGRYRIEEELGRGGMAKVFKGMDTVLGRPVAIKVLAPQFAEDANFVTRFRREAQAAARLNHPNLVGVYDTGSDDGVYFIVMEYVEAKTLADYLVGGGRIMPDRAIEIAASVCDALSIAHAHGIIHRDIKPANIMVTGRGEVKVTDFGIARMLSGSDTLAQTAAVLGTASYLSPEQAQGRPVDQRSDLYSLGCVMYEMVTGRPPFSGDSAVVVASKHVLEQPTPPSKLNRDVAPGLEAVIMKALAKNPDNRYQTAEELRTDLERARLGQHVQATPLLPESAPTQVIAPSGPPTAVLPPTEPEPAGSRWWVWVIVALLVLAGLGAGLYLLASALLANGETRNIRVPSVIGLLEQEATSELRNAGFEVGEPKRQLTDDPNEVGRVIDQDPEPLALAREGSTVTITIGRSPRQVTVPNVVGEQQDEAEALITEAGLDVGTVTPQADQAEPGTVIEQNPLPDDTVDKGTPVNLVVSSGPEIATVPDVVCDSLGKAESDLRKEGFEVEIAEERVFNPECAKDGQVGAQDPAAGDSAQVGSTVTLYESTDVPPFTDSPSPGD